MKSPENPHRQQTFAQFLDTLVTDEAHSGIVAALRERPRDGFYKDMRWHALEPILASFPAALDALRGFALERWDPDFGSFTSCNLKAQYIPDEDFVNGGRAFVLFNLVASNWTHVSQVANQAADWKRTAP
jgi:hypothetical protein